MRYSYEAFTLFLTPLSRFLAMLLSDRLVWTIAAAAALLVGTFAVALYRKPLAARRSAANQALLSALLRRPPSQEQQTTTGEDQAG